MSKEDSTSEQKCVKCGHNCIVDGLCQRFDGRAMEICGCKCSFSEAAASEGVPKPLGLFAVFYDGETRPVAGFVLEQDAERFAKKYSGSGSVNYEIRHVQVVEGVSPSVDEAADVTTPLTDRAEQNTSGETVCQQATKGLFEDYCVKPEGHDGFCSPKPNTPPAHVERSLLPTQESSLLPASEMIDRELVQLALESHARALMYPNSRVQHDRANECAMELLRRLNTRSDASKEYVRPLWTGIDDDLQEKDTGSGAIYDAESGEFLFRVPPQYRVMIVNAVNAYQSQHSEVKK